MGSTRPGGEGGLLGMSTEGSRQVQQGAAGMWEAGKGGTKGLEAKSMKQLSWADLASTHLGAGVQLQD